MHTVYLWNEICELNNTCVGSWQLHVMTSVDKVLLAAEIRKTWHVKSIVAANSSDCITWQAWKSLLDSVECQNIGNLTRLMESFVCRVKGFSTAELRADVLQWELQSFGFVAKLFTVITVMWVLSFLGKLSGFPLAHWLAPRMWLWTELSYSSYSKLSLWCNSTL